MALRCWQPIRFLISIGAFVLEVKIERPIGVEVGRHPAAEREPIKRISHLVTLFHANGGTPLNALVTN
jgi:hypothetical protein